MGWLFSSHTYGQVEALQLGHIAALGGQQADQFRGWVSGKEFQDIHYFVLFLYIFRAKQAS